MTYIYNDKVRIHVCVLRWCDMYFVTLIERSNRLIELVLPTQKLVSLLC